MITRRSFLAGSVPLLIAPAALVELLAPTRTIFLPPRGGWLQADKEIAKYYARRGRWTFYPQDWPQFRYITFYNAARRSSGVNGELVKDGEFNIDLRDGKVIVSLT